MAHEELWVTSCGRRKHWCHLSLCLLWRRSQTPGRAAAAAAGEPLLHCHQHTSGVGAERSPGAAQEGSANTKTESLQQFIVSWLMYSRDTGASRTSYRTHRKSSHWVCEPPISRGSEGMWRNRSKVHTSPAHLVQLDDDDIGPVIMISTNYVISSILDVSWTILQMIKKKKKKGKCDFYFKSLR